MVKYTKKNTETNTPIVVGKIYADWCGACQKLQPEWEKMEKILGKNKNFIFENIESANQDQGIEKVNNTYLAESVIKLSLQGGYPTIFKIKKGILTYYNGPREPDIMVKFFNEGPKKNKSVRFSKNIKKHVFNNQQAIVQDDVTKPNNQGIMDSIPVHKKRLGYLGGMMDWIRGGKTRKVRKTKSNKN